MGLGEAKRVVTNKKLKGLGEMAFAVGGGPINWFPGHMAVSTCAIKDRLKLANLVVEVHDTRIPFSSASHHLQPQLSSKQRVVALNKKDLANPNIIPKWIRYFDSCSTNKD
nr:short integuments 2, mitochondrial [Quercus suber]